VIEDDCFAPVAATSIDDLLLMGGCGIDVEVHVTEQGRVHDQKRSLAEIGQVYSVTRERIRQIEAKALGRLRADAQELLGPLVEPTAE